MPSERERQESDWDNLIASYGYGYTSHLDREVYAGITSGFFKDKTIRTLSEELSHQIEAGGLKDAFNDALRQFWWGVDDSHVALEKLLGATDAAMNFINATEIYHVYEVLRDLGRVEAAKKLLDNFIDANKDRPSSLTPSEHFGARYDATFKSTLDAEVARFKEPIDLEKTLDAIDFHSGWNPKDLTHIAQANFDAIVLLLTGAKDNRQFAHRLTTLLKFGEIGESVNEKKVHEKTVAWLATFAATNPIAALRVRRFLPTEALPNSSSADSAGT